MSRPTGVPAFAPAAAGATDGRDDGLSEEIVECLERYCDGRGPELAGNLFEALGERAVRAGCGLERCTCAALLRHWFGIDRRARDTRRRHSVHTVVTLAAPLLVAALLGTHALRAQAQNEAGAGDGVDAGAVPERVVAVGGALTEIVYALGVEAVLIGVDTTSQYPESATALPQVGYQRNLSAEGILSLSPDLLLVTADAGPPEVLDQVRGAGIEILALPTGHDVDGVLERIDTLAQRFDRVADGERLTAGIEQRMDALQRRVDSTPERPKALFLLGASPGSAMASGSDTAADAMLRLAGADNVFADIDGYKAVGAESLIAAAPEAIVVVAHGASNETDTVADTLALPGVAQTPAGQERRVVVADALRLLGFGPRIDEAAQELFDALHGTADGPPSPATVPR